ncbi:MAG: S-methyl-5-thioribose-1-phosphate isomerase [Candidatus Omnitrophica bacterium]|nr:S-methyl-5-thioribose-1-phosphate isomerase [Candidatus Omnitrophota bacterium]
MSTAIPTIRYSQGIVKLIDQTRLPHKLVFINCRDVATLWEAIKALRVRGAPALGVAAGFGVVLGIKTYRGEDVGELIAIAHQTAEYLATSRPTAVNLFYGLSRMRRRAELCRRMDVKAARKALIAEAFAIYEEDRALCRNIGRYGAAVIKNGQSVLTVCNAGALATADYGTALGVMYSAKALGKNFKVYACETRPLLQGARLTTWELMRAKIDVTLICDNMAATLMQQGKVDVVITGADRISANGDSANKIGTYMLAVLAKYHKIPFYIAAPSTTFDLSITDGSKIPIEERHPDEVTGFGGARTATPGVKVYNPAFDVTDHSLITGIITERGIIAPVNRRNVKLSVSVGSTLEPRGVRSCGNAFR